MYSSKLSLKSISAGILVATSLFFSATVFAATAPGVPTNVSAVAGNASVKITFSPPSSDGGSPITSYRIATGASALSASQIVSPGSVPTAPITYNYTGLTNGTPYTFYITATNSVGTSGAASTGTVTPANVSTTGSIPPPTTGTTDTSGTADDISIQFQVKNPLGTSSTDLPGFVANVLNAIVDLLFPIVVLMLIYSGFLFVMARGNTEKLGEAKKALMYTLIGAAIVLGASGLAHVVQNTLTSIIGG